MRNQGINERPKMTNERKAALEALDRAYGEPDNVKSWQFISCTIATHLTTIRLALQPSDDVRELVDALEDLKTELYKVYHEDNEIKKTALLADIIIDLNDGLEKHRTRK